MNDMSDEDYGNIQWGVFIGVGCGCLLVLIVAAAVVIWLT